jgi:hypothetical protein
MPPFFFLLTLLFWVFALGGGGYLVIRFIRAYERRNSGVMEGKELVELRERLMRLEDSLESMSNQMQRLSDAQQFTTRLLEGRTETPPPGGVPGA